MNHDGWQFGLLVTGGLLLVGLILASYVSKRLRWEEPLPPPVPDSRRELFRAFKDFK